MHSIRVTCAVAESEFVIAELWDAGTVGIYEMEDNGRTILLAGFEQNIAQNTLLARLARFSPEWLAGDSTDWAAEVQNSWPARTIGERIFLAPVWSQEPTPPGKIRVSHNPGLACGTGEHPCTRMAIIALEKAVRPGCRVVDVGTGSAVLAIVARQLGATLAVGLDPDEAALESAKENFQSNNLAAVLAAGSAECLADNCADVTVANIDATVLLSILDELERITRRGGWLILTGFPETESATFERLFAAAEVLAEKEWRCVIVKFSGSVFV